MKVNWHGKWHGNCLSSPKCAGRPLTANLGAHHENTSLILALLAGLSLSGAAQAALHDRGGGLIYDSVRNVTYTDWRLPNTLQLDPSCSWQFNAGAPHGQQSYGYGCTGSEMGYMFYENMGATADSSILSGTNAANLALFTNLQSYVYWSGLEYAPDTNIAWYFYTSNGFQDAGDENVEFYAWAVRPGDVAAIPEAETYALMLVGLGLLGWRARRRG